MVPSRLKIDSRKEIVLGQLFIISKHPVYTRGNVNWLKWEQCFRQYLLRIWLPYRETVMLKLTFLSTVVFDRKVLRIISGYLKFKKKNSLSWEISFFEIHLMVIDYSVFRNQFWHHLQTSGNGEKGSLISLFIHSKEEGRILNGWKGKRKKNIPKGE